MTTEILLLCPLQGNGGIRSWATNFIESFPDNQYHLCPVDIAPDKPSSHINGIDSWFYGIKGILKARRGIRFVLRNHPQIKMMHITSSGGNGVFRDYVLGRICKKKGLKTILHCHFGSVGELYRNRGWKGKCFHKVLSLYDQIWVLDQFSVDDISSNDLLRDKVFLVPNPINVPDYDDSQPKIYKKIGFIGNLLPTKGIYELIEAVIHLNDDTELFIIGEGAKEDISKISQIIKTNEGKNIKYLGCLSNEDAVTMMSTLDIICLPTYYEKEAFPISVLEAMSRGKLVISCPRAAIPDMLKTKDGSLCGLLVKEKSPQQIADAIRWCQEHSTEADEMCRKAYEKAYSVYREEVVYEIYRDNYKELV